MRKKQGKEVSDEVFPLIFNLQQHHFQAVLIPEAPAR